MSNTACTGGGCKGSCYRTCTRTCGNSCSSGNCTGTCKRSCTGGCNLLCTGTCKGSCSVNCGEDCSSGCKGDCSGTCKNSCKGTCEGSCSDGCYSTCKDTCKDTCLTTCLNYCKGTCVNYCSGTCKGKCAKRCQSISNVPPVLYYWSWSFGTNSGDTFSLTASEWKSYLNYINLVRYNTGDGIVNFNTSDIQTGKNFTSSIFNDARNALNGTTSHGTLPDIAYTGKTIYGQSHFDRAKTSINDAAAKVYGQGEPNKDDYGQQTNEAV